MNGPETEDKELKQDDHKNKTLRNEILSFIRDIVIILGVFWLINTFVGTKTVVIGDSMESHIHDGDVILLNKLTYRFSEPERFDVIVFPYNDGDVNYIKRIIGLPGEEIVINRQTGDIVINGQILEENFGVDTIKQMGNQTYPLVIPEGQYFVMGDNRNESSDSRYIDVGTIDKKDIMGKAWLRVLPLKLWGKVQ